MGKLDDLAAKVSCAMGHEDFPLALRLIVEHFGPSPDFRPHNRVVAQLCVSLVHCKRKLEGRGQDRNIMSVVKRAHRWMKCPFPDLAADLLIHAGHWKLTLSDNRRAVQIAGRVIRNPKTPPQQHFDALLLKACAQGREDKTVDAHKTLRVARDLLRNPTLRPCFRRNYIRLRMERTCVWLRDMDPHTLYLTRCDLLCQALQEEEWQRISAHCFWGAAVALKRRKVNNPAHSILVASLEWIAMQLWKSRCHVGVCLGPGVLVRDIALPTDPVYGVQAIVGLWEISPEALVKFLKDQ